MIKVLKKKGNTEDFDEEKIIAAVKKSADRILIEFTDEELKRICEKVKEKIEPDSEVSVEEIHKLVECALDDVKPEVAKSYRDYRNYKKEFAGMMNDIFKANKEVMYLADRDNANADSTITSTKRSLLYKKVSRELYQKIFLNPEEVDIIKDGYVYIHDLGDRLHCSHNCCVVDFRDMFKKGFTMSNVKYTTPKRLGSLFGVLADATLNISAQQYGGFTIANIDSLVVEYAEKEYDERYKKHLSEELELAESLGMWPLTDMQERMLETKADEKATAEIKKELLDGCQQLEYKFNTVASSRGDFSFITVTFGLETNKWGKLMSEALMETRVKGQGDPAIPMLFPKLVFMTSLNHLHGEGMPNRDIFLKACEASNKVMYPDYVSLDYSEENQNYLGRIYEKYGKAIAPMGCRAFLSPFCVNRKTGEYSFNEEDPAEWDFVVEGRFNLGAYSLNLCMIMAKAITECGYSLEDRSYSEEELANIKAKFYDELNFYLDFIKSLIVRTYNYIGNLPASINPVMFTQGLAWNGNLKPTDKIKSILPATTSSFGYVGLNELQELYNGQSIVDDGDFAYEVLSYINDYKNKSKAETGINTALYSTPAESLAGAQLQQFRKKFGVVKNVSDREYFTNSFHMPVWADITPIEKQDLEERFFRIPTGGRIQYVRIPNSKNPEATRMLIERGVSKGFYQGVNLSKSFCKAGHEFDSNCSCCGEDNLVCPICGSDDITTINRVCGYLGFSKTFGHGTRFGDSKKAELYDRKSM